MKIHQIRNATIIVTYNDKRFLIDPWLMPKDSMPGFEGANPTLYTKKAKKINI